MKFCSPGRVDPTQTHLGELWAKSAPTYFTAFFENVISHTPDVTLEIPTVETWTHDFQAYSPNLKAIQR